MNIVTAFLAMSDDTLEPSREIVNRVKQSFVIFSSNRVIFWIKTPGYHFPLETVPQIPENNIPINSRSYDGVTIPLEGKQWGIND